MFDINIFLCGVYVIQNFAFINFIFYVVELLSPCDLSIINQFPLRPIKSFVSKELQKLAEEKNPPKIIFLTWLRIPRDAKLGATNVKLDNALSSSLRETFGILTRLVYLILSGYKISAEFELLPKQARTLVWATPGCSRQRSRSDRLQPYNLLLQRGTNEN